MEHGQDQSRIVQAWALPLSLALRITALRGATMSASVWRKSSKHSSLESWEGDKGTGRITPMERVTGTVCSMSCPALAQHSLVPGCVGTAGKGVRAYGQRETWMQFSLWLLIHLSHGEGHIFLAHLTQCMGRWNSFVRWRWKWQGRNWYVGWSGELGLDGYLSKV